MLDPVSELALKIQSATSKAESDALFSQLIQDTYIFRSRIIRRVRLKGFTPEDINSVILEGIWKTIPLYDSEVGPFLALAQTVCKRAVLTFVQLQKANKNCTLSKSLSLDLPVVECGKRASLGEIVPDEYRKDPLESFIAKEQTALFLKDLSGYERDVVFLLSEGSSYEEIAEQMDTDWKSIDNALCRVRTKALRFFPERTGSKIQGKTWAQLAGKTSDELEKQKVPADEIAKILRTPSKKITYQKHRYRATVRYKKRKRGAK